MKWASLRSRFLIKSTFHCFPKSKEHLCHYMFNILTNLDQKSASRTTITSKFKIHWFLHIRADRLTLLHNACVSIHLHVCWSLISKQYNSFWFKVKSTQSSYQFEKCLQNVIAMHARKGLCTSSVGKHGSRYKTNFISLKPVLAFQTLTLATLGKWATTYKTVFFLGKNCSWTSPACLPVCCSRK